MGPRILNTVLIPICLLGPMAYFIEECKRGAKRKPMPTSLRHPSTFSSGAVISIPKVFRQSALPQLLETDLFPCFATFAPAPAAIKAEMVEILKVWPEIKLSGSV